jgi:catechol 2,3-dioxygenase-like lactoylglutathione lyase family enzyme
VPARGIQHVDLAVGDVERSLAFYYALLEPLGLKEKYRLPTYRGTEEVIYLEYGGQGFGLRPADDGAYSYYGIGIEHVAFEVDHADEVDEAYGRCVAVGGEIQSPPERHYVETRRTITRSSPSIPTASASKSSPGRARPTARIDVPRLGPFLRQD